MAWRDEGKGGSAVVRARVKQSFQFSSNTTMFYLPFLARSFSSPSCRLSVPPSRIPPLRVQVLTALSKSFPLYLPCEVTSFIFLPRSGIPSQCSAWCFDQRRRCFIFPSVLSSSSRYPPLHLPLLPLLPPSLLPRSESVIPGTWVQVRRSAEVSLERL
jgi:hypothetical protein